MNPLTVGDIRQAIAGLSDSYPVYIEHTNDTEDSVVLDGFRNVKESPEDEGCFLIQAHVHYEDADESEFCDECGRDRGNNGHYDHCSLHPDNIVEALPQ